MLIRSYRLALKSKIVLKPSNISVVREFPKNLLGSITRLLPDRYVELVIKLVSCKPPLLQESVLDTPELVGQAKQQLGELEDESLSDLVHVKGYLFVCVCVEER